MGWYAGRFRIRVVRVFIQRPNHTATTGVRPGQEAVDSNENFREEVGEAEPDEDEPMDDDAVNQRSTLLQNQGQVVFEPVQEMTVDFVHNSRNSK